MLTLTNVNISEKHKQYKNKHRISKRNNPGSIIIYILIYIRKTNKQKTTTRILYKKESKKN